MNNESLIEESTNLFDCDRFISRDRNDRQDTLNYIDYQVY